MSTSANHSIANALGIFSPAITLAIFALIATYHGHSLDVETAFTTIAILGMVTHPANMIMTIVPRAIGTLASFDRIQTFLVRSSLTDQHSTLGNFISDNETAPSPAIRIQNLTVGEKEPILENINLDFAPGSLTIISGAVGSGKSTLLRAILGETPFVYGSIKLATRHIAYCAQKPWLPSSTIREAIHGVTEGDDKWYQEVIEKCCLSHDFDSLPDGDETQIGSRGFNLSGGQRQRVVSRIDIIQI